jgi:hypothetical protein
VLNADSAYMDESLEMIDDEYGDGDDDSMECI